jgi:hypothetical protein
LDPISNGFLFGYLPVLTKQKSSRLNFSLLLLYFAANDG